jgi:alpha-glucoside transport system substrate-binding protein
MRRLVRLFAPLAVLALFAGACGDDDDGGGGGGGAAPEAPDLSGEELEVAAIWTDVEQERFQAVLQAFEDDTGATITYTPAGDNMDVFLEGRLARGGEPDVAIVAQPALLRQLQESGDLVALTDAKSAVEDNFDEGLREALSVDGELYGVPFKSANKSLLWYNPTVLEDAGVEPPADWDALQESAQTIADSGVTPVSVGADVGWPLTDFFENVLLWTAGGEFYDQLANGEASWDSEEVKTALETMAEVWQEDWVVGGLQGAASATFTESATQLVTEPSGFMFEGDFVAGQITGEEVGEIGTDADFVPFPAIGDGSAGENVIVGGDFPVLLNESEAGQALMAYLASAEAQEIWVTEGGFLSSNTAVDSSAYPDDVTRRAAEQVQEAGATRFDLSDLVPPELGATEGQGLWKIFTDFLQNPDDVDGTATALQAAAS